MAEELKAAHPAGAILLDSLQDEARRNRRALLAVSSICLAARFTGTFPQSISALGISFSSTHERQIIWVAILVQTYLAIMFVLSATTDFIAWRHELRREVRGYIDSDQGHDASTFKVDNAVSEAVDAIENKRWWLEAPDHRIIHELQKYMTNKNGLYKMLLIVYPSTFVHHMMLYVFPLAVYLAAMVCFLGWKP